MRSLFALLVAACLASTATIAMSAEPTSLENVTLFEEIEVTTSRNSQIEVKIRNASFFSISTDNGDAKKKDLDSAIVYAGGTQITLDVSDNPFARLELIKHSGFHHADLRLPKLNVVGTLEFRSSEILPQKADGSLTKGPIIPVIVVKTLSVVILEPGEILDNSAFQLIPSQ